MNQPQEHHNLAALVAELQRIAQEVYNYLYEPILIAIDSLVEWFVVLGYLVSDQLHFLALSDVAHDLERFIDDIENREE